MRPPVKTMLTALLAMAVLTLGAYRLKLFGRPQYCQRVCADARTCGLALPPHCETRCNLGHRQIPAANSCQALKKSVDELGYLW